VRRHSLRFSENTGRALSLRLSALLSAGLLLLLLASAPAQNFLRRIVPGAEAEAAQAAPVRFVGAAAFSEEQLRSAIATQLREIQEGGLSPARGDDAAFFLGSFYRKNGYAKVEVEYTISGRTLTLRVKEGPRVLIGKVHFTGNRYLPDEKLYEYMIGANEERLAREPAQFPYTEAELSAGADRVRGLYNYEGYLEAKVDTARTTISRDGTRADVVVQVTENMRYTFGEISFAGETVFDRGELLTALGEPTEGAYSPTRVNSMQRHLESFYKSRGYYQARWRSRPIT
jgi:outer membrane protein assembly factor BamA